MAKQSDPARRQPARLLIVDACRTYADGLRRSLEKERWLRVVESVASAGEAQNLPGLDEADLALVDTDLPGLKGFELCQWLIENQPDMNVVMLSFWDWDIYLARARDAGASGFLLRSTPTPDLVRSLGQARYGRIFSEPQLERLANWREAVGEHLATLGAREWDVLWLVASGITNREISERLGLSENTIEKHVSSILHKLGLQSRLSLLAFIHRHHLDASIDPLRGGAC